VWSGKDYIKGANVGVSNYLTSKDAENMIRSFINNQKDTDCALSPYLNLDNHHPEVIVLFTEGQLRSEQLTTYADSLLKFRSILSSAQSSLQAPFVDMSSAFDMSVVNIVTSIQESTGSTFYFGKGTPLLTDILSRDENAVSSSRHHIEEILRKKSAIFSNGKTDLIIVYLSTMTESSDKFTETDSTISEVHKLILSHTDDYVCVYTALSYENPEFMKFGAKNVPMKRFLSGSLQGNGTNGTVPTDNTTSNNSVPVFRQYFGGWFWELFVVMAVLLPFLIIGTYSIDSIQTPLFEDKKKN